MRRTVLSFFGTLVGLAACSPLGPDNQPARQCGFLFESRPCIALQVEGPWGVLAGDTVRVNTISDSGYSTPVTWALTGNAEIVAGSEKSEWPFGYGEARSILVRAGAVGVTTVTATHSNPARSATITLPVVDSSVIARIDASSQAIDPRTNTLTLATSTRVGDSLRLIALVYDGNNHLFNVAPSWTTSDTSLAVITNVSAGTLAIPASRWVRGRAAGSVDVIGSFRSARATLRITITP